MLSRLLTTRELVVLVGVAAAICVGGVAAYLGRPGDTPATGVTIPADPEPPAPPTKTAQPPKLQASPPPQATPVPPVAEPAKPAAPVTVSIVGAIGRPGIYILDAGSRVADLVRKAEGLLEHADVSDINLAAVLIDGTTLTVPQASHAEVQGGRLVVRGTRGVQVVNPPEYTRSGWGRARTLPPASQPAPVPGPANVAGAPAAPALVDLNTATAEQLEGLPGIGPKKAQDIIAHRQRTPFTRVDDLINVRGIGPKTMDTLRPLVTVGGP